MIGAARLLIATTAFIGAAPVMAQSQAQQDRLNKVGQFIVTAPMCESLGMTVDPNLPDKAAAAINAETSAWGVDPSTLDRLKREAVSRQGAMLQTDLKAASEGAKTEAQLRKLHDILMGYGRTCLAATADPIFSKLIVAPAGYDLEKAATARSDAVLESGGLASWQTPAIQARGDLMMLAGTCRSKIGPARSDALVKQYGQSTDPRIRSYYSKAFDEGLADPTIIDTLAGCNRAIEKSRVKAVSHR